MKYQLAELAKIVGGSLQGSDVAVTSVSTDSRTLTPGSLFVALPGENFDGHDFIDEAMRNGAVAAITSRVVSHPSIQVENTLQALADIARAYRTTLSATVIAITGSSGKTSTKDLLACALGPFGKVVKSDKSLNNEIGVPLTIFQADDSTDFLILEMGMRGLGQIDYLTRIATPNISLLLNAGSAHLSELGSRENILKAKSEIFNNMSEPRIAITSADDQRLVSLIETRKLPVHFFGQSRGSTVQVEDLQITAEGYPSATLIISNAPHHLVLPRLGEHQMLNAAAVMSVIESLQLDPVTALHALATCADASEWRMEVTELQHDITLINDAYNANPESVRAGLKALKDFAKDRRTWAVLGEMRELGETSIEEHDAIGRLCVRLDIAKTVAVGQAARSIQLGASHEGSWNQEALYVDSVDDVCSLLKAELQPGDVIYVKASRAVGLERVAKMLEGYFGRKNSPS